MATNLAIYFLFARRFTKNGVDPWKGFFRRWYSGPASNLYRKLTFSGIFHELVSNWGPQGGCQVGKLTGCGVLWKGMLRFGRLAWES